MLRKINVAFIYEKNHKRLSRNHYDNTLYYFFMHALKRNNRLSITYFPSEIKFDVRKLKNKFNVILLVGEPGDFIGLEDLDIPVVRRIGDPHTHSKEHYQEQLKKYKIDYYFGFVPASYFYKYYPSNFQYKTIIHGLEPSLYKNVKPFEQRIKNRILNSGNAALSAKIFNRFKFKFIYHSNVFQHYKLRSMCNELPYVDYTSTLEHEYVGDKFPLLLQKYSAAIAATTTFPTVKYQEIPAAGCLTFMEITEKNNGEYLGFIDGETSIFINEKNYKEKFEEYLSDLNNPKWKKIANNGRHYALTELNNDKAVNSLADLMTDLL